MPFVIRATKTSRVPHALIVDDDVRVGSFLEGVMLDGGLTAESMTTDECREYALRRRYDVAVVGIDGKPDVIPATITFLQRRKIPLALFSVRADSHVMALRFPGLPLCRYDARTVESLASQIWRASRSQAEPREAVRPDPRACEAGAANHRRQFLTCREWPLEHEGPDRPVGQALAEKV